MAELSLNRRDIAGFLYEVWAHGMAGVMGHVNLNILRNYGIEFPDYGVKPLSFSSI